MVRLCGNQVGYSSVSALFSLRVEILKTPSRKKSLGGSTLKLNKVILKLKKHKVQLMKDIKKIEILFKKDAFILKSYIISYFILYIILGGFTVALVYLSEGSINNFFFEFFLFLWGFVLAIGWAAYMPIRSITYEEKERTFKILKGLPFTNYHIFFSKLLSGYVWALIIFGVPGLTMLIHRYLFLRTIPEDVPTEFVDIVTLTGFIGLIFLLLLISALATSLYMNFKGSQIFVGVEILLIIFITFSIITHLVRKDSDIYLIPFLKFIKVAFLFSPLLAILCIFLGYKLFDKHKSYIKFQ